MNKLSGKGYHVVVCMATKASSYDTSWEKQVQPPSHIAP